MFQIQDDFSPNNCIPVSAAEYMGYRIFPWNYRYNFLTSVKQRISTISDTYKWLNYLENSSKTKKQKKRQTHLAIHQAPKCFALSHAICKYCPTYLCLFGPNIYQSISISSSSSPLLVILFSFCLHLWPVQCSNTGNLLAVVKTHLLPSLCCCLDNQISLCHLPNLKYPVTSARVIFFSPLGHLTPGIARGGKN